MADNPANVPQTDPPPAPSPPPDPPAPPVPPVPPVTPPPAPRPNPAGDIGSLFTQLGEQIAGLPEKVANAVREANPPAPPPAPPKPERKSFADRWFQR